MGRQDVRTALERLDDDEVREHVADGDLSALADLDLDDDERALVADAARDFPEVVGFGFAAFEQAFGGNAFTIKMGGGAGSGYKLGAPDVGGFKFFTAYKYAMGDGSV